MRDDRPETVADHPDGFVNTADLLAYLGRLDVALTVDGESLALSAPKGVLTPGLQRELKSRKAEVIAILQNSSSKSLATDALSIHELVEAQVARAPADTAVVCGPERLTYGELSLRSSLLAARLRAMGLQPEAIAGICLDRSVDMVVALLAVLKAGAAYLPLDPEFPSHRLAFMLEDSGATVLLSRHGLLDAFPVGRATVLYLDEQQPATAQESSTDTLLSAVSPDSLAYVIYTSGSTGRPKGVAVEHRSVVNLLRSMLSVPGISAQDRLLAVTTMSFDIAGLEIFLPLIAGAQLTIAPRTAVIDGAALVRLLHESQATIMQATPITWRLLLASGWEGLPRLKMLCGGEALSRELAHRLLATGGELWNLYGPTETTIWSTVHRVDTGTGAVPIGRPIANTQAHILDEQGRPVPPGVAGELYIGGLGVARGYLGRPQETAARFVPDPFRPGNRLYRTGDMARQWADGQMECLGRNDQQVKLRGFRIELGEIETALEQQPGVRQAVVMLREDDPDDPRLTAYVIASTAGDSVTLRNAVAARLPRYMVPSAFVFLDAFPVTPNKKVDRKALPAPDGPVPTSPMPPSSDSGGAENKLSEIWRNLLKVTAVGRNDNFFEVGGHSLLIVQLQSIIRQQLAREVSIPDLFRHATIAEQCTMLESIPVAGPAAFELNRLSVLPMPLSVNGVNGSAPPASDQGDATREYLHGNGGADSPLAGAPRSVYGYASRGSSLVVAQSHGTRRPLFLVAGFQGPDDTLLVLSCIVAHLGPDQPVYGFRPRWVWREPLYASVEEEASEYLVALRTVQPHGPYLLGGYCLSGLIAFEMARQLHAEGERVGLLALIDTERPSTARTLFADAWHAWERTQHMGHALRDIFRSDDPTRSSAAREVVRRRLQRARNKSLGTTPDHAFYRTKMEYQRIIREYVPRPYPGRITLLVNEFVYRSADRYRGWRGFAAGEFAIRKVSGDHISMFKKHGNELAQALLQSADPDVLEETGPADPAETVRPATDSQLAVLDTEASQPLRYPEALPDPEPQPALITVRDVTMRFPMAKRYREWVLTPFKPHRVHTALTHASLSVQAGDRIAVMGPNGAGKTTLLKLMGGLIFPNEGQVRVNGFDTVHHNDVARRSVGFVFNEERSFFWRLSGVQNLEFFGALDNLFGPELRHRVRDALRLVGLEEAAHRPVSGYSSGMKQRLALARVLMIDPDVLILDEPTRALDPIACDKMVELLLAQIHRRERKTLLIATHRIEEAMTLCNKVMIVDGGRVKAFDSIPALTAAGITLLEYYRNSVTTESIYESVFS